MELLIYSAFLSSNIWSLLDCWLIIEEMGWVVLNQDLLWVLLYTRLIFLWALRRSLDFPFLFAPLLPRLGLVYSSFRDMMSLPWSWQLYGGVTKRVVLKSRQLGWSNRLKFLLVEVSCIYTEWYTKKSVMVHKLNMCTTRFEHITSLPQSTKHKFYYHVDMQNLEFQ